MHSFVSSLNFIEMTWYILMDVFLIYLLIISWKKKERAIHYYMACSVVPWFFIVSFFPAKQIGGLNIYTVIYYFPAIPLLITAMLRRKLGAKGGA